MGGGGSEALPLSVGDETQNGQCKGTLSRSREWLDLVLVEPACSQSQLVTWCFEHSQPQRIISEPETHVNPSTSYFAQKSQNRKKYLKCPKSVSTQI